MRAVRCNAFGPPESLVVEDIASPEPAADEALIIQNKYQTKPPLPFTPGVS